MKKYLFVLRRLPHDGNYVQEILDMLLTTAAFDQQVSVLFADDGVLQIKTRQNSAAAGFKDTAAVFGALDIYGVSALYVEIESLQARGLAIEDLILPVQPIKRREVNQLMLQHEILIPY
ncbi:MAG: sulfurtransferase complex subunit TusC [Methylococcaceae bacterium]|nr:sulfurtransferase complex subunit TusC [Methylococcaceae bacterium]